MMLLQPFRFQVVARWVLVAVAVASAVATLLVICGIAVPTWLVAGWDDSAIGSALPAVQWSPYSFCKGAHCTGLPDDGIFGAAYSCSSGVVSTAGDSTAMRLRASQALSMLSFLFLVSTTVMIWISVFDVDYLRRKFDVMNRMSQEAQPAAAGDDSGLFDDDEDDDDDTTTLRSTSPSRQQLHDSRNSVPRSHEPSTTAGSALPSVMASGGPVNRVTRAIVRHTLLPFRPELRALATTLSTEPEHVSSKHRRELVEDIRVAVGDAATSWATNLIGRTKRLRYFAVASAVLLFFATLFLAVSIGLFDMLADREVNCGASVCALLAPGCHRGSGYRSITAGNVFTGVCMIAVVVAGLLMRQPVHYSDKFIVALEKDLLAACARADEVVHVYVARVAHELAMNRRSPSSMGAKHTDGTPPLARLPSVTTYKASAPQLPSNAVLHDRAIVTRGEQSTATSPPSFSRVREARRLEEQQWTASSPAVVGRLPPAPEGPGDQWALDPSSSLYYNAKRNMYFDPSSGQFYDPRSKMWNDGNGWYHLESESNASPALVDSASGSLVQHPLEAVYSAVQSEPAMLSPGSERLHVSAGSSALQARWGTTR